jgi:hypothetical protein
MVIRCLLLYKQQRKLSYPHIAFVTGKEKLDWIGISQCSINTNTIVIKAIFSSKPEALQ